MTISRISAGLLRQVAAGALALAVSASGAMANFAGGGALFAFTPQCTAPTGWGPDTVLDVQARYVDVDAQAQPRSTSEFNITFPFGSLNYALWQTPFIEGGPNDFRGATGRSIFSSFFFATTQPRIRVVHRRIVTLMDPNGPATLQNARSVVVRLRIQNFAGVPGCAATVAATLRRR